MGILDFEVKTGINDYNVLEIDIENTGTLPIQIRTERIISRYDCEYFNIGKISNTLQTLKLNVQQKVTIKIPITNSIHRHKTKSVISCSPHITLIGWQTNFKSPNKGFVVKKEFDFNVKKEIELIVEPKVVIKEEAVKPLIKVKEDTTKEQIPEIQPVQNATEDEIPETIEIELPPPEEVPPVQETPVLQDIKEDIVEIETVIPEIVTTKNEENIP
jgi:hypothetical protein